MIVAQKEDEVLVAGCLTSLCLFNAQFSYSYLKGFKFPFNYKGWRFIKVNYIK